MKKNRITPELIPEANRSLYCRNKMLPWHNIQIYLNSSITPLKEKEISLTAYQKFWKEVENGVINGTEYIIPKSRKKKVKPEVGDES